MSEENAETTEETTGTEAAEAGAPEEAATTGVDVDDSPDPAAEETGEDAETTEETGAVIPTEDIHPVVEVADNRTPAEKDLAVLIAAQKIRQDPVRFMAAKAVPGAPFLG